VNSLSVRQEYNPQVSSAHLGNWSPAANSTILLNNLLHRVFNDALNPFQLNRCPIGALAHRAEVLCELHELAVVILARLRRVGQFLRSRAPGVSDAAPLRVFALRAALGPMKAEP